MDIVAQLNTTADYIKKQTDINPEYGIVLGSGLGAFADQLEDKTVISYDDIPGFFKTSVHGHAGELVIGKIGNKSVAVLKGRVHAYEGHSANEVVFPIRFLANLGVSSIVLTNASGGINKSYHPGQLVLIKDHINLSGINPLIGPNNDELGKRFPDMTYTYTPELRAKAIEIAKSIGFELKEGVYAGVMGPTYETPAEVKMLGILGADLVGMSTVNEAIAATHMGVNLLGISCVTNMAAGILDEKLSHDDIQEEANKAMVNFIKLLTEFVKQS